MVGVVGVEYPPGAWVRVVVVVVGVEIDFAGVFWGVCAFFGGGWWGYTGKSFLPFHGH